jgi:hypothetical protein
MPRKSTEGAVSLQKVYLRQIHGLVSAAIANPLFLLPNAPSVALVMLWKTLMLRVALPYWTAEWGHHRLVASKDMARAWLSQISRCRIQ